METERRKTTSCGEKEKKDVAWRKREGSGIGGEVRDKKTERER